MGIFFFFFFGCYYVYCFGSEAGVYTKLQWNLSTKTTIERVGEREREREKERRIQTNGLNFGYIVLNNTTGFCHGVEYVV